jgi:hypothetical protein
VRLQSRGTSVTLIRFYTRTTGRNFRSNEKDLSRVLRYAKTRDDLPYEARCESDDGTSSLPPRRRSTVSLDPTSLCIRTVTKPKTELGIRHKIPLTASAVNTVRIILENNAIGVVSKPLSLCWTSDMGKLRSKSGWSVTILINSNTKLIFLVKYDLSDASRKV